MNEWISVKDRLPDKAVNVLTYSPNCGIGIDFYVLKNKEWFSGFNHYTHWTPLPKPPKENEE